MNEAVPVVAGIIGLFALIVFLAYYSEKLRTSYIMNIALQLGFAFEIKREVHEVLITQIFRLFSRGHSRRIRNYMTGRKDRIPVTLFDYRYTTGGGKNSHHHSMTVFTAKMERMLPSFSLVRESIFHKLGDIFMKNDIDFEDHPVFSKKFFLKGEEPVRAVFTDSVIRYFEENDIRYNIEVKGMDMIIYSNSPVRKKEYMEFVNKCVEIVRLWDRE